MTEGIIKYANNKWKSAFRRLVLDELLNEKSSTNKLKSRILLAKFIFGKKIILNEIEDISMVLKGEEIVESSVETNVGHRVNGKKPATAEVKLPSLKYYVAKDVIVNPESPILFLNSSDRLVRQFFPYPDQLNISYTSGNIFGTNKNKHVADVSYNKVVSKGIMLTGSYSKNWYHWTIEILSRAAVFQKIPDFIKEYPLVVPAKCANSKNHYDILKLAFPESKITAIDDNTLISNCVYIDSPMLKDPHRYLILNDYDILNSGNNIRYLLNEYRSLIFDNLRKYDNISLEKSHYSRKIFLARKQHKRSYNQDEVEQALKLKGYIAVYLEDMSVKEQILQLQNADYVVGPTGAAWANLLFSDAKGALIWAPSCITESITYTKIAQATKTNLHYMTFPTEAEKWSEFMKTKKPYHLDVNDLLEKVGIMENESAYKIQANQEI